MLLGEAELEAPVRTEPHPTQGCVLPEPGPLASNGSGYQRLRYPISLLQLSFTCRTFCPIFLGAWKPATKKTPKWNGKKRPIFHKSC
jgi:hypothetical protein